LGAWRAERISGSIHREIDLFLRESGKDPLLEPISITRVEVSKDRSSAKVFYLPLGGDKPSETLVEALEGAARRVRGPIGRNLRLRHAPQIRFVFDDTAIAAYAVNRLIQKIGQERPVDPATDDATGPDGEGEE
jgi:ribosome-binding factor A